VASFRFQWASGQYLLLTGCRPPTPYRIDKHGEVATVAGRAGAEGNADGPARDARFCRPWSLALHPSTSCLFIAEHTGRADGPVRCLDLTAGTVLSLPGSAGLGHCGISYGGADGRGELLLCDGARNCVYALAADGEIYVVADGGAGPGCGQARGPGLPRARAIVAAAQAPDHTLYIPDAEAHCVFAVRFPGPDSDSVSPVLLPTSNGPRRPEAAQDAGAAATPAFRAAAAATAAAATVTITSESVPAGPGGYGAQQGLGSASAAGRRATGPPPSARPAQPQLTASSRPPNKPLPPRPTAPLTVTAAAAAALPPPLDAAELGLEGTRTWEHFGPARD
jgi:hypothetical protein